MPPRPASTVASRGSRPAPERGPASGQRSSIGSLSPGQIATGIRRKSTCSPCRARSETVITANSCANPIRSITTREAARSSVFQHAWPRAGLPGARPRRDRAAHSAEPRAREASHERSACAGDLVNSTPGARVERRVVESAWLCRARCRAERV